MSLNFVEFLASVLRICYKVFLQFSQFYARSVGTVLARHVEVGCRAVLLKPCGNDCPGEGDHDGVATEPPGQPVPERRREGSADGVDETNDQPNQLLVYQRTSATSAQMVHDTSKCRRSKEQLRFSRDDSVNVSSNRC